MTSEIVIHSERSYNFMIWNQDWLDKVVVTHGCDLILDSVADNRIRHIPVIDEKGMIGMVSIGDVVRAVVREHRQEVERLNAFIQGGY